MGSAMSIFGLTRFSSSLSVLDCAHIGSSLSIRSFARVGSGFSVFGKARLGSSLSVLDFFRLGSSLSMRSIGRVGSAFSVFGVVRMTSSLSLFDCTALGSSLSMRSSYRLGSRLSVMSSVRFGSSLSVLDFVNIGSTLSVGTLRTALISDGSDKTYVTISSTQMELYANAYRGITLTASGGTLHGAWSSEASITTSDRRLKRNIQPLYETIANRAKDRWDGMATPGPKPSEGEQVKWLLRELRPVSFQLKRGAEAKYLKFGFIAQELETVFPNLVRTVAGDTKAIASQDLIAVLTLAFQNLQKEHDEYKQKVLEQDAELQDLKKRLDRLERVRL